MAEGFSSDFALLDVKKGRKRLFKCVGGQGFGKTGKPTGERIPVTITGFIVGAHSDDDGTSREFEVEVIGLDIQT